MTGPRTRSAGSPPRGRRKGTALALAASAAAGLLAMLTAGSADAYPIPLSIDSWPVWSVSGQCLDDAGASTANNNPVQVYPCNSTAAQNWTIVEAGSTVRDFGKCLDVFGGGTANGSPVDLYDCNGTGAQVWIPRGNTFYNPQSNKCLDDPNGSPTPAQLQIWDCNGSPDQQWWLALRELQREVIHPR